MCVRRGNTYNNFGAMLRHSVELRFPAFCIPSGNTAAGSWSWKRSKLQVRTAILPFGTFDCNDAVVYVWYRCAEKKGSICNAIDGKILDYVRRACMHLSCGNGAGDFGQARFVGCRAANSHWCSHSGRLDRERPGSGVDW